MNDIRLRRVSEKRNVENLRRIADRGNLVGVGRMRHQAPFRIPDQFFARKPTGALDETAFHLAERDPAVNRVADVVENIDAADASHAGESIDLHFAHGRADRVIVERFSTAGLAIVIDVGGSIKSSRAQTGAREVSALEQLGERETGRRVFGIEHEVVVENDPLDRNRAAIFFRKHRDRERQEPGAQGIARVPDRGAVQVGPAGRGGGGCVRDLVGARGHDADAIGRETQLAGGDQRDVGVNALAHLGAAVIHLDGAVLVKKHERASLVQVGGGE